LPGTERQRGRLVGEGVDHVGTVRPGQPVVQREERPGLNGLGLHGALKVKVRGRGLE
jgi:hypothetical protein